MCKCGKKTETAQMNASSYKNRYGSQRVTLSYTSQPGKSRFAYLQPAPAPWELGNDCLA